MSGTRLLLVLTLAVSGPGVGAEEEKPAPPGVTLMTLEEALNLALQNNLDVALDQLTPDARQTDVDGLHGAYDPIFGSEVDYKSRTSPASNVFAGADKVDTTDWVYNLNLSKQISTGGSIRVDFDNTREATNSVFSTFNPSYNASFLVQARQPLLRNFKIDATRHQIRIARRDRDIADTTFRQTVVATLASVRGLYFDFIYAVDNLEAQRGSLNLAKQLLEENRIRVRVGTLAPLEVVAAESEVAAREEAVIVAEAAVKDAEDLLKRAISPRHDGALWATTIRPKDRPAADPTPVDEAAAVQRALAERPDLQVARKRIENALEEVSFRRKDRLPSVDLVGTYGTTGIGGRLLERDGFGGPVLSEVDGGYGDAISDVVGQDFPTWSVGVSFTYTIRNRAGKAAEARAAIAEKQAEIATRKLEMAVATEVRAAARAVDTNFKRVLSARAARVLREQQLDAENKKFAAGMSTNFLVTQAQRDLALAEVAELLAGADYHKSLANFDRVQGQPGAGYTMALPATGPSPK